MSYPLEQWLHDELERPRDGHRYRLAMTSDMFDENNWVVTRYSYGKTGKAFYQVVFTGERTAAILKYEALIQTRLKHGYQKRETQLGFCF